MIVRFIVACMFLLLLHVFLSLFLLLLIFMRFRAFLLNNHAFIVQVGGTDSIAGSCCGLDLDILAVVALTGI